MQTTTNYIGIDISKLTFDVAIRKGQGYSHHKLDNNEAEFSALLHILPLESMVVMEASGSYYLRLACFLYRKSSSYIGLCPRIYESGTSVKGKSKICKLGMSKIRSLSYMCAWSACRYNKACSELYQRLLAKGKAKKLALIAVANKLLKQAFAMARKHTIYNENYSNKICF